MMKLSAVVLTRNEHKNIERCLASLKFCDEIIVIDDNSTDRTVSLAKKIGAKVYTRSLAGDFAAQKNFALTKAKGDWVLFIDADEVVTKELRNEIEIEKRGFWAYAIPRRDFLWGKELNYGEVGGAKFVRLIKKGRGRWQRRVHEVWNTDGETGELTNCYKHYPHQTLSDFIRHINQWSDLHAQANFAEGKRSDLFRVCLWPLGKFVYNYILRLGFLDGMPGFMLALMMSAHSYLAWSKLWMQQRKNQI